MKLSKQKQKENYKFYLDETVKILNSLTLISKDIEIKLSGKKLIDDFFFNNIVSDFNKRFGSTFYTLSCIVKELESNPNLENSISILLRSSLLDFIQILFLVANKGSEKSVNKILSDHVKYSFRYADFLEKKDLNNIKKPNTNGFDHQKLRDKLNLVFEFLIDKTTGKLIEDGLNIVKEANEFEKMNESERIHLKDRFFHAYDKYILYSKVEHYGIMSSAMQYDQLENLHSLLISIVFLCEGTKLSAVLYRNGINDISSNIEQIHEQENSISRLIDLLPK